MNALVTGVSRRAGIGFAIVRRLQERGANVFVHGWTAHDARQVWGAEPDGLAGVAAELRTGWIEAAFADGDAPARVVAAARAGPGPLAVLVANPRRSGPGGLAAPTAPHLEAVLPDHVPAPPRL